MYIVMIVLKDKDNVIVVFKIFMVIVNNVVLFVIVVVD